MRTHLRSALLLALGSIVATSLGAEVAARVWLDYLATRGQVLEYALYADIEPSFIRVQPHQYLDYRLTPNYSSGATSHNSLGYRGDEFPLTKPAGEFRIVALGGSTTYDEFIDDNKDIHTRQLEDILRLERGYRQVRVINAGVPAYTSWESLVNLQFRVLDLGPDLVLHYDNNNDAHARLVPPSKYTGDNSGLRKPWTSPPVPAWQRSVLLRVLSRRLRYTFQAGIEDVIDGPFALEPMGYDERIGGDPMKVLDQNPPVYFERNVRNMIALEKDHRIVPVLVTYASTTVFADDYAATRHYQRAFAEHNEIYRRLAAAYGVPLLDLQAVMPTAPEYFIDGRHSSPEGARKRAEIYADFLISHHLLPDPS